MCANSLNMFPKIISVSRGPGPEPGCIVTLQNLTSEERTEFHEYIEEDQVFLQGDEGVITLETCRGHSPKPGGVCLQFPSRVAQKLHFSVGNLPKKVFSAQAKNCCQVERGHTGFSGPGFLLERLINEPEKISSGEHSVRMVQYQNNTIN